MITVPSDSDVKRSHAFEKDNLSSASKDWNCKYHLRSHLDDAAISGAESDRGYLYFVAEQYGFENNVYVLMQPRDKYYDFNFRSQTNNPDKYTKVFRSRFGRKYLIPAEYDILVLFGPSDYNSTQEVFGLEMLSKWVANTDAYVNDDTVEIVTRLAPLENPEEDEVKVVPVDTESPKYE